MSANAARRAPSCELCTKPGEYKKQVYALSKHLNEKVASLHLGKIGAKLVKLTHEQSKYLGVPQNGPFKPEHYRY
jgi:adenosylhomocysteinase